MIPFPEKRYSVIYADPPWSYRNKGTRAAADNHYQTMSLLDIQVLPVQDIAADDCALFLWATFPMLREAIETIEAWGFSYKTAAFVLGPWELDQKQCGGLSAWDAREAEESERIGAQFIGRTCCKAFCKALGGPGPHRPTDGRCAKN